MNLFKYCNYSDFKKVVFGLGICFLLIGCGDAEERDRMARANLKKVAFWFVADGIAEHYQGKSIKLLESKIEEFGVYSTRNPGIVIDRKDEKIADLTAESFGWGTYVRCYARIKNESIYEYWVVEFGNRHEMPKEIIFLITRAGGMDQSREIIYRSNKFFPAYDVSKDKSIKFPVDDKIIYGFNPWLYPEAFIGTELEDVIVVVENKKYIRKKYTEVKKTMKKPTFWEELLERSRPIISVDK